MLILLIYFFIAQQFYLRYVIHVAAT